MNKERNINCHSIHFSCYICKKEICSYCFENFQRLDSKYLIDNIDRLNGIDDIEEYRFLLQKSIPVCTDCFNFYQVK